MYLPLILMENVFWNPQDCFEKEVFQLHSLGWMPAFSFEYSRLRVGPRSVNHLNVCFNMHQPIRLLVCSKLGKHIDVPSNRDGVAHVILCFADLVPAVCREAAMRKLCFANKYRAVTTLILTETKATSETRSKTQSRLRDITCLCTLASSYVFWTPKQGFEPN